MLLLLALAVLGIWFAKRRDRELALLDARPESHPREVQLAGVGKTAIATAFPAALDFPVTLPLDPELRFATALVTEHRVARARVAFEIEIAYENERYAVFRREFQAADANRWHDARVDLGAWAGKPVRLTLRTTPVGGSDVPWAGRVTTAWGEPVVGSRATTPLRANERPSFLLILVDTLRADYLGTYGFPGRISPNLDRLAAESLVFDSCFANAPWTKPSIASLFTSLHPNAHGVRRMGTPSWSGPGYRMEVLSGDVETLAERFEAASYETAAFTANPFVSPRYGFSQGFQAFQYEEKTGALLSAARRWISDRAARETRPFFLYLHLMDVHGPYDAPERDYEEVLRELGSSARHALSEDEYLRMPAYLRDVSWSEESDRLDLAAWRARYGAGVHALDREMGEFLRELRTSGILDRTYLVLTSDHGEELMEHGGWNHGTNLYEEQLHVPLLIRKPLAADAGGRIDSLVSLVDLMPTLLSLGGVDAPSGIAGRDLTPLLRGLASPNDGVVFAEAVLEHPSVYGMRTRDFKVVWDLERDDLELYDLRADPEERRNLGSEPGAALWKERLRLHLGALPDHGPSSPTTLPDPELQDRLRALGYVN